MKDKSNSNDIGNRIYGIWQRVIDNRNLNMTEVVDYLLDRKRSAMDVAAGYFYISGLQLIEDKITDFMNAGGHLRIVMGQDTNYVTANILDSDAGRPFLEEYVEKINRDEENISDYDFMNSVLEWIEDGQLKVRVYTGEGNYFHAKSYMFYNADDDSNGDVIVGSSNFSKNGFEGNTELNFLTSDSFVALHRWYDEIWDSDETEDFSKDLVNIVKNRIPPEKRRKKSGIQEYLPVRETYYNLAKVFSKPYARLDDSDKWADSLYEHQKSGVVDIKDKLDTLNTGVLADGVGLGKTRTAAGVIRLYLKEDSSARIMIVADAKLKEQWIDELKAVGVEPGSYEYKSRDAFVRMDSSEIRKMKYNLVIVDEAHLGFKNNNTKAYNKMLVLKENNPDIRGLMLTATPWNNRREDVINIGMLFLDIEKVPNDREYKQYILSGGFTNKVVKKIAADDKAFNQFWEDVYLQRTRNTYGGQGAKFPQREFPVVDIPYDSRKNKIFSENFEKIVDLKFPYMDPIKYIDDSRDPLGARQLKLLLLKRADSSWISYRDSLARISRKVDGLKKELDAIKLKKGKAFLNAFKNYLSMSYNIFNYEYKNRLIKSEGNEIDLFAADEYEQEDMGMDDIQSSMRKKQYAEKVKGMIDNLSPNDAKRVVEEMYVDSSSDLEVLDGLIERLDAAYSKVDEKLDTVIREIEKEQELGHKVIVVTQFADTAKYYYEKLYAHFNESGLNLPMGLVTGGVDGLIKMNESDATKNDVLNHFSPRSKGQLEIFEKGDDLKLLVGTDTISFGQNLQDAVTLMNLDLPYNPMTLEQRIGRIDRPREEGFQQKIFIYTFPVYSSIDSQLKMAERLGEKMKGVLDDTQFDNVVLPEYKIYLEKARNREKNAAESMIREFDARYIHDKGMHAEIHSQQYKDANQRLYDVWKDGIESFNSPFNHGFSFSSNGGDTIVAAKIEYKDANGSELGSENVIVNVTESMITGLVEAEKQIHDAIPFDVHNRTVLPENKAASLEEDAKSVLRSLVPDMVKKYNEEKELTQNNQEQIYDKLSEKAALNLRESTSTVTGKELVKSSLAKIGMPTRQLGKFANYIRTIQKDDASYELVKRIANDEGYFWTHIEDFKDYISPEVIQRSERVGAQIKRTDSRRASAEKTSLEFLLGNVVIK